MKRFYFVAVLMALFAVQPAKAQTLIRYHQLNHLDSLVNGHRAKMQAMIKSQNFDSLRVLAETRYIFTDTTESKNYDPAKYTFKNSTVTLREYIIFQFLWGEHKKLMRDVIVNAHYFMVSGGTPYDTKLDEFIYYNYDTNNLTLDLLDVYKDLTDAVDRKIESEDLLEVDQELLKIYWRSILQYIESKETLPKELSTAGRAYKEKFPKATEYHSFLDTYLIDQQKAYKMRSFNVFANALYPFAVGGSTNLSDKISPLMGGQYGLGYNFSNYTFGVNFSHNNYWVQQDILTPDSVDVKSGSVLHSQGFSFFAEYHALTSQRFNVSVLAHYGTRIIGIYKDNQGVTVSEGLYAKVSEVGFGFKGSVLLLDRIYPTKKKGFLYTDEEHRYFCNPLYLTFGVKVQSSIFQETMGLNGAFIVPQLGFEWKIGKKHPEYLSSVKAQNRGKRQLLPIYLSPIANQN